MIHSLLIALRTYIGLPALGLVRAAWAMAKRQRRWVLGLAVGCLCLCAALYPVDAQIVDRLGWDRNTGDTMSKIIAKEVSECGKFEIFTLLVSGGLFLVGLVLKRPSLRNGALACFLAATFAGLNANALRASLGRARPNAMMNAKIAPGFYGPNLVTETQSFPSAHAATSSATAIALVAAFGWPATPVAVFGVAVAWSRIHLRNHHLSDVLAGIGLGLMYGLPLGMAARRARDSEGCVALESATATPAQQG